MLCFRLVLLVEAHPEQVVRNRKNRSYYRFVGLAEQRVRIRPLELFPNGLLIEKTADTIVDPDIEVDVVGQWAEEFFVDDQRAEKLQEGCEQELERKRAELVVLEAEYETIDPNAHGGRGSHANKIKAVAGRVEALERGLSPRTGDAIQVEGIEELATGGVFAARSLVQLPSGCPALVMGTITPPSDAKPYARVRAKAADGRVVSLVINQECLRPWEARHMATI